MKAEADVLIAMADAAAAQLCEKALLRGAAGLRVRHAQTPDALSMALKQTAPDIVLLEWSKTGFDRAAALEAMRRLTPDAAVIAIADSPDMEMADDGVFDTVAPSHCDDMDFAIRRALAQGKQSRERRREAEALRVRVAMAEAGQRASLDGILVTDRRGQIVSVNPRFRDLWGLTEIQLRKGARTLFDTLADRLVDPENFLTRLRALMQNRNARSHFEFTLKNGSVFDTYSAPMIRDDAADSYLGRVWYFRDLTAFPRAQDQAREEEGLLRAFSEQDVAGTMVFERDGRIRYINPKFAQMLGYDVDDVMNRDFADFIAPPLREETATIFRRVADGTSSSERVSTQIMTKSGGAVDVLGQWTAVSQRGQAVVVGIAVDVTALRRTEKALAESEDLYRTVVASLAEGILVVHPDGTIVAGNESAARTLGVPLAEISGRMTNDPKWGMIHEDGTPITVPELPSARALRDGKPYYDILVGVHRADGEVRWLSVNAQPLYEKGAAKPTAAVVSFTDVTPHKLDQDMLTRVNHTLTLLSRANETVVRADGEQDLLDRMCRLLVDVGGYHFAWIGLEARKSVLSVRAVAIGGDHSPAKAPAQGWETVLCPQCSADAVFKTGKPEVVQDLSGAAIATVEGVPVPRSGSRIVLPLFDHGAPLGLLALYSENKDAFSPDGVNLLVQLAENLSYGIASLRERGRREEGEVRLRQSMEAAVQAIASTLEMRDPYTAGHQRDVARLAVAIAHEVGVPEEQIEGIYLAAIVHDIGKIRIPIDILSKPGPLTKLEYQLIQTHAQIGHDIIKNVDFPWPVAQMILQHHERLDGSGYPAGLKDGEILEGARIIAVADVVQAMSMRRPYRGPFGDAAALAEIERGRGRLYDPVAVDACLKLFREKGFKFE